MSIQARKTMPAGRSVLFGFTALTAVAAFGPAFAQDAAPKASVEEVVVTGSYLSHAATSGSPVRVLSPTASTPQATIGELFLSTPEFSGNAVFADPGTNSQTGASFINLRGLGPSATLVLLNGRRQVINAQPDNRGRFGVDIESLTPQIMISRVEVVKSGASATYGTDAVAGVVNFITRNKFSGAEMEAGWDRTNEVNQNTYTVSGLFGGGDDDSHFVIGAEWVRRDPLVYRDYKRVRDFANTPGNVNLTGYEDPGTYRLIAGQTYNSTVPAGAPTRTIVDPLCGSPTLGAPDIAGILQTTGVNQVCAGNGQVRRAVIGGEDRVTVLAVANRNVNDYFKIDGQVGFTRKNEFRPGVGQTNAKAPIVPASNPGNPFGGAVSAQLRYPSNASGIDADSPTNEVTYTAAVNFSGKLPIEALESHNWTWETGINWSENNSQAYQKDTVTTDFQNALNGFGGPNCNLKTGVAGVGNCVYFNPFASAFSAKPGSALYNSPDLIDWLLPSQLRESVSTLLTWHAIFTGELFSLPAGSVGLAVGYEGRRESLSVTVDPTTHIGGYNFATQQFDFAASRIFQAGFFELRIPVLSNLEVQAAGRYEEFSGSSDFIPKVGFTYKPVDWLNLRGTYGKSFQAPYLQSVYGTGSASVVGLVFPGVSSTSTKSITQPNADLQPQKSTSYTAGFDLRPLPHLTTSVDYYKIEFKDLVVAESAQQLINGYLATGANADRITLDAAGLNLVNVYLRNINAASVITDGYDFAAAYDIPTDHWGHFNLNGSATYIHKYTYQQSTGGVIVDALGSSNSGTVQPVLPKWKINLGASWDMGPQRLVVSGHYTSGITNSALPANSPLQDKDSYTTVDMAYSYTFAPMLGGPTTLRVGIDNIFDKLPPFQAGQQFYPIFGGIYDPRGRVYSVDVKKSF